MFLLDPFYGYVQGDFTMEEDASPAKILLDLINVFNQIHEDCLAKLQVSRISTCSRSSDINTTTATLNCR